MTIAYNKKRSYYFLCTGIIWILLGIFQFFLMRGQWWFGLGWIVLGFVSLSIFGFQKKVPYLTLNSEFIKENKPFGKQIKISDIQEIKYFSEEYILESKDQTIRININLIEENKIEGLKQKLLNLIDK